MNILNKTLKTAFKQKQIFYNPYQSFSYSRDIAVNLRDGKISFDINFPNKDKKIFFIDDSFTFGHLKNLVEIEYPNYSLQYDFSNAQNAKSYDEYSRVAQFMNDQNSNAVKLLIDDLSYNIKNTGSYTFNTTVNDLWNREKPQNNSDYDVLQLYQTCIQNNISSSHSGVLSHFLKKFMAETQKLQGKQLTDKEVDNVFEQCIKEFSDPVKQKLEFMFQRKNELVSQLESLENEKKTIEGNAEKRINFYIKLIFLASVIHITSFYYMIFEVSWLGWDIIEPITYSVSVLTTLLGIRYYMRYRQNREVSSMQNIWRNRMIMKNRLLKDRYLDIMDSVARKQQEIKNIDTKIDIYQNRKNYTQFLKDL